MSRPLPPPTTRTPAADVSRSPTTVSRSQTTVHKTTTKIVTDRDVVRTTVTHGARPTGGTHAYTSVRSASHVVVRPPHHTSDHRYARPSYHVVRPHPHAHYHTPHVHYYRPYYTRWYVHPYYRHHYSTTVVVSFGFGTHAWVDTWSPPHRHGWVWVGGYWDYGYWHPGYWAPVAPAPVHYVYVPGYWDHEVYVDGFYRSEARDDGDWTWVEGYYLDDGTYVRGHWRPNEDGPEGYTWEAGFWDGETWVEGFWRPEFRPGYSWMSSYYDEDGVFHSGYWMPSEQQPGFVYVPGWFDGNEWVDGYWVKEDEYAGADIENWKPEEGWNDGWEVGSGLGGDGEVLDNRSGEPTGAAPEQKEMPLGIPVSVPEDIE